MGRIGRIGSLDPTVMATLKSQAASLDDDTAHQLLDVADATPYGEKQRWLRYGIGVACGMAVGLVVARL